MNRVVRRVISLLLLCGATTLLGYSGCCCDDAVLGQEKLPSERVINRLKYEVQPVLLDLLKSGPYTEEAVLMERTRAANQKLSNFTRFLEGVREGELDISEIDVQPDLPTVEEGVREDPSDLSGAKNRIPAMAKPSIPAPIPEGKMLVPPMPEPRKMETPEPAMPAEPAVVKAPVLPPMPMPPSKPPAPPF